MKRKIRLMLSPSFLVNKIRYLLRYLSSVLDADWTRLPYISVLFVSIILSRIPLLDLGYGEPDAWRIARSALDLRNSHFYETSRFPGYPLPEYFNAIFINHGWIVTNATTLFLFLVSVYFFAKICNKMNVPNKGLLVLTYSFFPILWVNSANTMDYIWALTFIMITWFFTLKSWYVMAGIMLGLAIGSRPTSIILIVPFIYLVYMARKDFKPVILFVVPAAIVSFVLFLPLFIHYGFGFISYAESDVNRIALGCELFIEYFGFLAAVFGVFVILVSSKRLFVNILKGNTEIIFLTLTFILLFIMYFYAPHEAGYLIPIIPFGLILISKISSKRLLIILCVLLLSGTVFIAPTFERNEEGDIVIVVDLIDQGLVQKDIEVRSEQMDFVNGVIAANVPEHSIVITGGYHPAIDIIDQLNGNASIEKGIQYRQLVPLKSIQELKRQNWNIYYTQGTRKYTKRVHGYDLEDYDAIYLDPSNDRSTINRNVNVCLTVCPCPLEEHTIYSGDELYLTISETNTGDEPLNNPFVWVGVLDADTGLIIESWMMDKSVPDYQSGDANDNDILDKGEAWIWYIAEVEVEDDVTIIAKGHGTFPGLNKDITYPDYPRQRDSVYVKVVEVES